MEASCLCNNMQLCAFMSKMSGKLNILPHTHLPVYTHSNMSLGNNVHKTVYGGEKMLLLNQNSTCAGLWAVGLGCVISVHSERDKDLFDVGTSS